METTRLIVLRGPSGSGKSTVAKHLFGETPKGTVLIEQDYYRFIFKPGCAKGNTKTIHKFIVHNVLTALSDGYDVILEGILNTHSFSEAFSEIFYEHPKHNHVFYFDVSLDETIKRHRTRQTVNLFNERDMRGWYRDKDMLGYEFEHIIPECSSVIQTVATIRRQAGV